MEIDVFKVSKLRISDSNELCTQLTNFQKKEALKSYNIGNINNYYVNVDFLNGSYVVRDNVDVYFVCKELNLSCINIGLTREEIKKVVSGLKTRSKREVLNPMLSALIYQELMDMGNLSQKDIARIVEKSQGAISNKLRLLKLTPEVQREIIRETIKERHGRAILQLVGLKNYNEVVLALLQKIIINNMKVSDTEDEVYRILGKQVGKRDALHIKKIVGREQLKSPAIGAVIEKVDTELVKTLEVINKYFPNLEIELNQGIDKEDYVFLLKMKGINK
ncbi:MAG: ParB/RepB/Spo0J family partition protein [Mycoplasmatales bacterium]